MVVPLTVWIAVTVLAVSPLFLACFLQFFLTLTHTHAAAEWVHSTTKSKRKTKQEAEAWDDQRTHTLIAPVKQNTHTEGEREGSPTQCNENKTETVTVLRPCSQAGRQRCVWRKREHQRACMGVHAHIQWAHYCVCLVG
ncbi:hypothetical protein TCDM_12942 [Trypanosoma cruzi Dm28c]|uniref:Uncharacterized protein n=1 Tax=Trypanosoma cruzi Dm28c TaxID=1416333 RepID=V5APM7_TRYCR|nr:hypothetical protein TCDM_12942 [Trypanosoma cruzi Dm28c]